MAERSLPSFAVMLKSAFFQSAAIAMLAAVLALGVNQIRGDGIPLVSDWSPSARIKSATGDSLVIPLDLAYSLHGRKEALFVDARPADQYAEGHIAGAINIPWQKAADYLGEILEKAPDTSAPIITYCDGETCTLSHDLALMLEEMGYSEVKVLVNGWTLWRENGYPVQTRNGKET